ncbi:MULTISPECIES: TRAP transporter substrate-binding protein [Bacillaceae]|uniref:Tripartite ATP-independent transporter DctP family solute receptor n=1 Tax=Peribacillus huizhouensis TaxID=1501239 RepID=A0ABR6CR75_9BACI|nr:MULTISPECIES: TRAP transporter substrate-binding protein [Bacillaceae]MBA9027416.1 tripartite ATP-independent transporter DctP family solute receptor [Peribacillus huizhouensis]
MRKNKITGLLLTVVLVAALFLTACSSGGTSTKTGSGNESSGKGKRTLRISMGVNEESPSYAGAVKFKEIVESKTDDFNIEIYHSSQLADDRGAIEMLQLGTLEMVIPSTSPVVNFIPEFGVFDLPFTITNEETADKVLDGPFGDKMLGLLAAQDLVGLAWWENGFRNLTNSKHPVETVEDLKGLKIRTMENEIHLDLWKSLGANPTPMAFGELFVSLQQGVIDGQENPYASIYQSKFYEVQKYVSDTNHVYTPFLLLLSKKVWDELTPEQQVILKEAGVEAGKYNRQVNREDNAESLEKLKETLTFSEISPEELERFKQLAQPTIEKYKDKIGAGIVDEYMKEIAK